MSVSVLSKTTKVLYEGCLKAALAAFLKKPDILNVSIYASGLRLFKRLAIIRF